MERELTARDEGKPVLDANDEQIGIVTAVDDDEAYIDPDPALVDELRTQLGWGTADDAYPLPQGRITDIADDEIRLDIG